MTPFLPACVRACVLRARARSFIHSFTQLAVKDRQALMITAKPPRFTYLLGEVAPMGVAARTRLRVRRCEKQVHRPAWGWGPGA